MKTDYAGSFEGADEERLWNYIDGSSSAEEKTMIRQLLESNLEWRTKYHELLEVHQLMQSSELEEPSMRFTKNVMDDISRLHIAPATKTYINKNIIRGIAAFFILMIIGFLVYGFGQIDWSGSNQPGWSIDLSKINIDKFFNNTYLNIFMMVNLVLGLFLLDRYLASKKKRYQQKV
jgi:hypothetical protein